MDAGHRVRNMKHVSEELLAGVPESNWLPIPFWGDAQAKWLPLLSIPDADNNIGVTRSGQLFAIANNGYIRNLTDRSRVPLLILLRKPLEEVTALIATGVKNSGLPEDIVQVVVNATILVGLSGSSDYWQSLSMDWLAEIEHVDDDDILAAIEKVVTDGRTQQVRHRARRILKSLRRSHL